MSSLPRKYQPKYYRNFEKRKTDACPHCLWVQADPNSNFNLAKMPCYTLANDNYYDGLTVIDSRNHFYNAFNCINGTANCSPDLAHDYTRTLSLLFGIHQFVLSLYNRFVTGNNVHFLKNIKVLINNSFKKKFRTKEHPHGFVILDDDEAKILDNFFPFQMNKGADRIRLKTEPYAGDIVFDLTQDEINNIYDINNRNGIKEYIRGRISNFDFMGDSFYIFIDYTDGKITRFRISCENKHENKN